MSPTPRQRFAEQLHGDVLEIGPGAAPFPTAPGARVTYADRKATGGRDTLYPELAGTPYGPEADVEVDLDRTGLRGLPDAGYDAVVASHVIEHVADPVGALREMHRVLRPGGLLAIIVPDRTTTFDAPRQPTPAQHVLAEHADGVREVSEEHIREFCQALHDQPRLPIHTDEVWSWHDPARLDADLIALHRARSIHVHCWRPEEFAVLLAAVQAVHATGWDVADLYVEDDVPGDIEFGLLLRRTASAGTSADLLEQWTDRLLSDPARDPERLVHLQRALVASAGAPGLDGAAEGPVRALARALAGARSEGRSTAEQAARDRRAAAQREQDILSSRTHRAGRLVSTPLLAARRLRDRG
jgi:SAM-dependent methyltransferase